MTACSVAWWVKQTDDHTASTRLRTTLLRRQFDREGIRTGWFDPRKPQEFARVIIRQRYAAATLDAVQRIHASGGRAFLDLCDNHFLHDESDKSLAAKADVLRRLAVMVDAIVVSTPALATVVQRECPGCAPLHVIGDLADDLSVVAGGPLSRLRASFELRTHQAWLQRTRRADSTALVWFGHHGGGRRAPSGMAALISLRPALESLHAATPLSLTAISNNRRKFVEGFAGARFPTRYAAWSAFTFDALLRAHDIVVIPALANAYTECKTDNRIVTALSAGLAVVANEVPSYRPFAAFAAIGDMESGLRRYLGHPEERRRDGAAGAQWIRSHDRDAALIRQWKQVLTLDR